MKKWLLLIGVAIFISGCQGLAVHKEVPPSAEKPVQELVAHSGWGTSYDQALSVAKSEGKHILIDFSGSDWCGWCIKLNNEVFSKDAFKAYAKENLVLVLVDFPNDKSKQSDELQKQNEKLAKKFGVRGFPIVYILSSDGNPVAKTGYQAGGSEAYVEHIKKLIADEKK